MDIKISRMSIDSQKNQKPYQFDMQLNEFEDL